jgi:electron transfer flavoprotein alpha subunit
MKNDILVFTEIRNGSIKKITREIITAAGKLAEQSGGKIHAALVGHALEPQVEEMRRYVTGGVYTVIDPVLGSYSSQGFTEAMAAVIETADPGFVLFGATAMGKDLSARLAARCRAALMTDCTEVGMNGGAFQVVRPVYSGKVYAEVVSAGDALSMASIRPNVYPPAEPLAGETDVFKVTATLSPDRIGSIVREIVKSTGGGKDLTEAEIIVSGGRALKNAENFKLLEELAAVLGGTVGASRAAVDAGYVPHSMQVGQTGKVVNPKLYLAIGISGAIQHLVGMRTSKVIVAINKDPNAPIFQKADYGIVGDLFEIVPMLTNEFRKLHEAAA